MLNDKNELHIKYEGRSDRDTPINLSNHSYFNLKGEGRGTIADHFIQVFASKYLPVDNGLIPTGVEQPVDGTPLDLRRLKRIGDSLRRCTHEQLGSSAGMTITRSDKTPTSKEAPYGRSRCRTPDRARA